MSLFTRRTERHIAACQRELIETHFREVDTMYTPMTQSLSMLIFFRRGVVSVKRLTTR